MKSWQLKGIADELISAIRRHVAEQREIVEGRVHAGERVMEDQRKRLDTLEEQVQELQARLQVRRVA
jgi:hypothetical protein